MIFALTIISITLILFSYLVYQSTKAQMEAMGIRMNDLLQRQMDLIKFKQATEARMISQDLKLKDLKDMADSEEKAVDFIAQEIIRMDREISKLRPVTRLVIPKGMFNEKENKKKSKTTH